MCQNMFVFLRSNLVNQTKKVLPLVQYLCLCLVHTLLADKLRELPAKVPVGVRPAVATR